MLHSVLGIFAGWLVGGLAAFAVQLPALILYPLPRELHMNDRAALENLRRVLRDPMVDPQQSDPVQLAGFLSPRNVG